MNLCTFQLYDILSKYVPINYCDAKAKFGTELKCFEYLVDCVTSCRSHKVSLNHQLYNNDIIADLSTNGIVAGDFKLYY